MPVDRRGGQIGSSMLAPIGKAITFDPAPPRETPIVWERPPDFLARAHVLRTVPLVSRAPGLWCSAKEHPAAHNRSQTQADGLTRAARRFVRASRQASNRYKGN